MIRVLIVDDSAVTREHLKHILSSSPELEVVAMARSGQEAIELTPKIKPDVITMDINMPGIDGFETTRTIMQTHPVPIVIASTTLSPDEVKHTFRALEAGAVTVVKKPVGIGHPNYKVMSRDLIQTVKLMSGVKVSKRRLFRPKEKRQGPDSQIRKIPSPQNRIKVVVIGISTGGPPVLRRIISELPSNFPVPVLIVQHISAGFLPGLIEWLSRISQLPISLAVEGTRPRPGHIYFAPDDHHMGLNRQGKIILRQTEKEYSLRPAASFLFRSVVEAFGPQTIGLLLTGMGKDGAAELKLLRDSGAITIVQDKESSAVHGMPGEAIKLGAAMHMLSPDKIAATLVKLTKNG